eukprot:350641_1
MTEKTQSTTEELINLLESVDVDAFLNEIEENEKKEYMHLANLYTKNNKNSSYSDNVLLNTIDINNSIDNENQNQKHSISQRQMHDVTNSKSDESKSEYQKEEEEVNNNGIGGKQNERKPKVHILGNVKELKECNEDQMVDLVNEICDKTSELISQKHIFVSYFKENNI